MLRCPKALPQQRRKGERMGWQNAVSRQVKTQVEIALVRAASVGCFRIEKRRFRWWLAMLFWVSKRWGVKGSWLLLLTLRKVACRRVWEKGKGSHRGRSLAREPTAQSPCREAKQKLRRYSTAPACLRIESPCREAGGNGDTPSRAASWLRPGLPAYRISHSTPTALPRS